VVVVVDVVDVVVDVVVVVPVEQPGQDKQLASDSEEHAYAWQLVVQ